MRGPPAEQERYDDIAFRFVEHGSYVSPQLCMGIGLLDGPRTSALLTDLIKHGRLDSASDEMGAAVAVLERIEGSDREIPVETGAHSAAPIGHAIVEDQWNFWREHLGTFAGTRSQS